MHGPLSRAERYQKVATQYLNFAKTKTARSPFLRSYYQRTGEKYRLRATRTVLIEAAPSSSQPTPQQAPLPQRPALQ
jgi:hypothetical protein